MAEGSAALTTDLPVPDHVPAELVFPLDQWNGADYLEDPIGYLDGLRERYRVFFSPYHGGFWCITRYEDVHEAFQRTDLFSNRFVNIPGRPVRLLPISLDPPEHTKYRRLINPSFSPGRIAELRDRIRDIARTLIADISTRQGCEFLDEFAARLPTQVFCELLGLPIGEAEKFLEWNYAIIHVQGGPEGDAAQKAANEQLGAYLSDLVEFRRSAPTDDVLSALVPLELDGRALSHQEVVDITYLLFMAGLDTVIAGLCFCWKYLAEHPEHRRRIVDNPEGIPDAVEELLRTHSFLNPTRTVVEDVTFAGVAMKAGDRVMLAVTSSDRDPTYFPASGQIDFERKANRHIAFAVGPHRCVGSHLARAELVIAMEEWHKMIPDYSIPHDARVMFHGGAVVGLDNLPLNFE